MTNHPIEPHPALTAAAKAIHEHLCRRNIMQYLDNDEDCEGIARAVLETLRSPTDDMVEAGQDICGRDYVGHGFDSDMTDPEEVFTAMINTIIGESA